MRRPSFQFYPADWLGNSNLRRCTHVEKGVWVDVMCLMHDSGEYGLLRWPLTEIAQAVGCNVESLQALITKGVMKGTDSDQHCDPFIYVPRSGRRDGEPVALIPGQPGPIWYSSRMVRDEYVRQHRGEASRFHSKDESPSAASGDVQGESPKEAPKAAPMPPFGHGSSSSSSSSNKESARDAHVSVEQGKTEPKRKRQKSSELTLTDWFVQERAAGRKFISDYKPVKEFARNAGIPEAWTALAWVEFKRRFTQDTNYADKAQKDWRATFLNYVRKGWLGLWELDRASGQYRLTLAGVQLQREDEALEVAA